MSKLKKEKTIMSKTKEELNKLKEEVEAVNEKLQELTPEELEQVSGGILAAAIVDFDYSVDTR